jgi:hypothetical protein
MNNKKVTIKDVELGQMIFGNPFGEFECPEYVEAMVAYIFDEIERVYWNKNQKEWDRDTDPEFKGIKIREYYWGEDEKEAAKPNFTFKDVELRWYKHFGRSMTLNVSKDIGEWIIWFDDCLKCVRKNEPKI